MLRVCTHLSSMKVSLGDALYLGLPSTSSCVTLEQVSSLSEPPFVIW